MDWDGDGELDILSGSYWSEGAEAGHIEFLKGLGDLKFAAATPILDAAGKPYTNRPTKTKSEKKSSTDYEWANICTHQHAVDYDADGDLDLVVGCIGSDFYWAENTSSGGPPEFSQPSQKLEIGSPGGHAGPHLVDWDGDGDLDLLTGSDHGGAYWSQNVGTREVPRWAPFEQLVAGSTKQEQTTDGGNALEPASSSRVWVVDWNRDGLLDLLLGDAVSITNRKEGISESEYRKRKSEFDAAMSAFDNENNAVAEENQKAEARGKVDKKLAKKMDELRERVSKLWESKAEFQEEKRTGFVWLYLQEKPGH